MDLSTINTALPEINTANVYTLDDGNSSGDGLLAYSAVTTLTVSKFAGGTLYAPLIQKIEHFNSAFELVQTITPLSHIITRLTWSGRGGTIKATPKDGTMAISFANTDHWRVTVLGYRKGLDSVLAAPDGLGIYVLDNADSFEVGQTVRNGAAAAQIDCTLLHTNIGTLVADMILWIVRKNVSGQFQELYTHMTSNITVTSPAITVEGMAAAVDDLFLVAVLGPPRAYDEALDSFQVTATTDYTVDQWYTHYNPADFAVAYTSNITVTCTGAPFVIDDGNCTVVFIQYKPTGGEWQKALYNGANGVSLTAAADVITLYGGGTPFVAADEYRVGVRYQDKAYDSTTDSTKVTVLNPDYNQYSEGGLDVDTTNVATGTYYPSATGMEFGAYHHLSLTGSLIDGAGETTTLTVEGMNDEDTAAGDWITGLYGYDAFADSTVSSIAATNETTIYSLHFDNFNHRYFRVKIVTSAPTNTVIVKSRRSY